MQNINFNNKAMTKNKKELCRTMQKISRTSTKKQPLNKERYVEKVKVISNSKDSFSSSKKLQPALALKKLSDNFLLFQTKTLVQKERKLNIEILQHLQEIESRKLYLERGFSSLFDYAVRELGYSRGSAFRRIKAMKLCQDIPETKSQLESGKLNLSSASQLQNFFEKQARKPLKQDLKNNHLSQKTSIEFLKQQQSKNLQFDIKDALPNKDKSNILSNLRSDSFCAELDCSAESKGLSLTKKKELLKKAQGQSTRDIEKILVETDSSCVSYHKEKVRFIGNQKVELKVILDGDCFKNLETLKNLLSHKNPRMSYRELISLLAELGLKKYDPRKTLKRKQKLTRKQENQKALCSANVLKTKQNEQALKKNNRLIPQRIRQYIWKRDQGECSYICPQTNNKCRSKHLLQIDHIQPFALGGSHHPDNLRLLCARHNQLRSQRTFGFKL